MLALAASALAFCLFPVPAEAAKQVDSWLGKPDQSSGFLGGEFKNPRDVAVDETTGQVYVAEATINFSGNANQRVQRFAADGTFELAFGRDVLSGGGTGFEICTVASSCQPSQTGTAAGEFDNARGIAVDQESGDLYVMDGGNRRIQQFSFDDGGATPADSSDDLPIFVRMWGWDVVQEGAAEDTATDEFEVCTVAADCQRGSAGSGFGQFRGGQGTVAVHPGNGEVFVADGSNLQRFDPDAVLPGDVFVEAFGGRGIGDPPSTGPGDFSRLEPAHVAVDANGIVYASDGNAGGRIQRYDSEAAILSSPGFLAPIETVSAGGPLLPGDTRGLEIDSTSGNLLVLRDKPGGGLPDGAVVVQEIDTSSLTSLDDTHFDQSEVNGNANGLAVNGPDGIFYISRAAASPVCQACVFILDDDGAAAPAASVTSVTDETGHAATLNGTVNSNSSHTTYRFEVSADGGEWSQVGEEAIVSGDEPQAVSREATGLEANAEYRARIVASKPFGGPTTTSPEFVFATPAIPPDVAAGQLVGRTDTMARVAAVVNANNQPTTYRFEYVDEAEFQTNGFDNALTAPEPEGDAGSGGQPQVIIEQLSGLEPETAYRFRMVATNLEGPTEGPAGAFTTRAAVAADPERGFEMVSPPFKITRSVARAGAPPGLNAAPGVPSVDGESIVWGLYVQPLLAETAIGLQGDRVISRRTADGWVTSTLQNLEPPPIETQTLINWRALSIVPSGDLETQAWGLDGTNSNGFTEPTLIETEGDTPNQFYVRRDGTGLKGWTPWLTNVDEQVVDHGLFDGSSDSNMPQDNTRFNDDGSWMVRWGAYRGLLGQDPADDPSVDQLHGGAGGNAIYRQGEPPNGTLDLVNECSGEAGGEAAPSSEPTELPLRTAGGLLAAQDCEEGELPSPRGAVVGGDTGGGQSSSATALSQDGRRVFFTSPDPSASGVPSSCGSGTGAATSCPPQLFVRQYDSDGDPIVRWISRPQVAGQQIGLLGGAGFQGASEDGRYVYFETASPLSAGDPNASGSAPVTTGSVSEDSWDLYRYELPAGLDADPDEGSLLRVSGGPDGDADPNTNEQGAAARYISDDGRRAYFVTAAPAAGADATPPTGGTTTPGGESTGNATRNLYLFDDTGEAPQWTFVARLPAGGGSGLNECSTTGSSPGQGAGVHANEPVMSDTFNCVRGTPDGSAIAFLSLGRLTADDTDDVADIYLYDAEADELTRVTSSDSAGFTCARTGSPGSPAVSCRGHFGFQGFLSHSNRGWGGTRHFNIARDPQGAVSVFFDSGSQLVPEDDNGDHYDVYRWREGELSLISRAMPGDDSWYSGGTADGEDVFIQTSDRIDPRELDDDDLDFYDVRIGGGFPYTPPPEPCDVLALECETEASPAPAPAMPATAGLRPQGNVGPAPRGCAKGKLRRGRRCLTKRQIARRVCRKASGKKAKRRCIAKQARRLDRQAKARRLCRSKPSGKAKRRCVRAQARRLERKQRQRAQSKKRANRRQGGNR